MDRQLTLLQYASQREAKMGEVLETFLSDLIKLIIAFSKNPYYLI